MGLPLFYTELKRGAFSICNICVRHRICTPKSSVPAWVSKLYQKCWLIKGRRQGTPLRTLYPVHLLLSPSPPVRHTGAPITYHLETAGRYLFLRAEPGASYGKQSGYSCSGGRAGRGYGDTVQRVRPRSEKSTRGVGYARGKTVSELTIFWLRLRGSPLVRLRK